MKARISRSAELISGGPFRYFSHYFFLLLVSVLVWIWEIIPILCSNFPRSFRRVSILALSLADLLPVDSCRLYHRYENLKPHGYVSFGNKKLAAKGSEQPSILLWGKRDPHSNGIADVDLSYNQADEVRALKSFVTWGLSLRGGK